MFSFFKRSKTRSNDKKRNPQRKASTVDACANEFIGDPCESPRSVATTAQVLPHQSHQYDNESVGERAVQSSASNAAPPPTVVTQQKNHGGFFGDIMAKGRNKRNHNNNSNYSKNKPKADAQIAIAANNNHRIVVAGNGVPLLLTSVADSQENFDEKQHIGMCAEFVETEGNSTAVAVNAATPTTPNCDATVAADAADFSVKNNSIRYDRLINEDEQEDVGSVATLSLNNTERIAYDDACAQHRDDRNSKQKQNRSAADDDDDCADDIGQQPIASPSLRPHQTGVLSDELVKEIIFEKYKRPVSPLSTTLSVFSYISPTANVVDPQSQFSAAQTITSQDEPPLFDANMGQQPTKHNIHPTPRDNSVQPIDTTNTSTASLPVFVALHSPKTSPPSSPTQHSPTDDKEIFYEADDDIEFLPTTASDLFNNQPYKNVSVESTFPMATQLHQHSEQFNNNNSSPLMPLRFSNENYSGNCDNGENRDINNSSDGQVPRNRSVGVRFAVPEDDYEVEHEDENDDDDDDDEDVSDDDEVEDVDAVVAHTEHLHNNDAVSHEKSTIFEKNNAIDDPDNEDHANYDNDDDDDNDSPDSGIDIVTDIVDISQILHNLEHETTTKSPPSSLSSSMISSSISIDTSNSSSSTNQFNGQRNGHENNNRITDSDNHNCNGDTQSSNDSRDSSAFNSNGVVQPNGKYSSVESDSERRLQSVGSDSDEIRSKGGSDEFEVSPRKLASLYNGGDISALSLPDIVESIGNSNNGTSNGTIMVSAASGLTETPTVSRTNGNYSDAVAITAEDETHKLIDNEKKDLVNQEARFTAQLEEAEKQAITSQTKANDLAYQINELERNLTVKTWNVERLQAELQAAYKEGEAVKKKLKLQEAEMEALRTRHSEKEDNLTKVYTDLQQKYDELLQKFNDAQQLVSTLQSQLTNAQNDGTTVRNEKEQCIAEHKLQQQKLQTALDAAITERHSMDTKWQIDFEQLRTHHSDREEHLMQDCEWKLRSTEQSCKAKVVAAEFAKREALDKVTAVETESKRQMQEVKHLKSYEAEVAQLRGLTGSQADAITHMTQKLEDLKFELEDANKTVAESIETVRKIQYQCKQDLSDKNRQMIYRIDEARGEVAVMWEDRLMEEMSRLKIELESCYAEDRAESLQIAHAESLEEIAKLTASFNAKEKELRDEIQELKNIVSDRNNKLDEANEKSDKQVMQIRVILDRSEREHQREMNAEIAKRDIITESLRDDNERERQEMEERFRERLMHVTDEFAAELTNNKEELQARHKKKMEQQYEKLMSEKEEAIQDLERKHKRQLIDAETKLRDIEINHQRNLKDMKSQQSMEKSSFEQRDLQSAQEIETLHKKCRCLTKLFEEMRMRYERRDPRPEDLRDIEELKGRIEAQDRDLRKLTEKLRELQMVQQQQQPQTTGKPKSKKSKVNCDVIYEENEDRESSPSQLLTDESHV